MRENEPTALYRFFSAEDALLYVGVSFDLHTRFCNHRLAKPWHLVMRIELTWYPDRESALAAETHVIRTETPPWNYNGSPAPPGPPRKFESMAGWIRELIGAGYLTAGERLPSAAAIARQDGGMHVATVRKAFRELIATGDLRGDLRAGVFVTER